MTGLTVAQIENLRNDKILKLTSGCVIVADNDAPVITTLFDTDGSVLPLPEGYHSCGLQDTSGIAYNRALTVDQVTSWQSPDTQRTDVSADKITVQAKFQETNAITMALNEGRTIAETLAAVAAGTNGMQLDKVVSGIQPFRRVLLLAADESRQVVIARSLPNSQVTALGGQAWQRSTELQTDITFECFPENAYGGSAYRYFVGGPGWNDLMSTSASSTSAWAATTAYAVGDLVTNSGATLQCTVAGTSGSTAPTNPAVGSTVTDGSVTWNRTA